MTPEEYTEYKTRISELMLAAENRGLVEESATIYADNYLGAIVGNEEGHWLKDMLTESGCHDAIVRRVNVQKIYEELERLLNPN